jgi:hypothetical protein
MPDMHKLDIRELGGEGFVGESSGRVLQDRRCGSNEATIKTSHVTETKKRDDRYTYYKLPLGPKEELIVAFCDVSVYHRYTEVSHKPE